MDKKSILIIKGQELSKVFEITVKAKAKGFLGFMGAYVSGIDLFNREGYLTKLIKYFLKKDEVVYWLILAQMVSPEDKDIKKALDLSSSNLLIHSSPAKRPAFPGELEKALYCLMFKDTENIKQIFEYLFLPFSISYIVFDKESNKELLYSKVKDFKDLEEADIINLSCDFIKFSMTCCSHDEEFKIFTNRFSKKQIKEILLNSVDTNKIEVREE